MNVSNFYKTYKSFIIAVAVGFIIGVVVCLYGAGGQLHNYKIRAEQYETLYKRYQAREAAVIKRLGELQNQLTASRKTTAELRESIKRSSEYMQSIGAGAERIGNSVEGLERTVRQIEKRGRIKN